MAVLGAGPIGLEVALYARALNFPTVVYEQGQIGEHLRRWGHVRLFSPFGMNCTSLGCAAIRKGDSGHEFPPDAACITGREHVAAYLEPLTRAQAMAQVVSTETRVLHVGRRGFLKGDDPTGLRRARAPFVLMVQQGKQAPRLDEADVVVDCTGTYGQHRWMGEGGMPAIGESAAASNIAYGLEDVAGQRLQGSAGKSLVVVGAGYSAATTVCNLASLAETYPDTWVVWLARGGSTQPIARLTGDTLKERDRLAVRANTLATRGEGNVEFHNQTVVESVEYGGPDKGFRLRARCAGKARAWEVDRVIANVGYTPDTTLYTELQIHECPVTFAPFQLAAWLRKHPGADWVSPVLEGGHVLRNPEPNFYILGAKSYGRNSHFLLRTGFEQVREVFTLITGKSDLNLYKNTR
jgi:thioredoxin reductase